MKSNNVVQIMEDYLYVEGQHMDLKPGEIIQLLELAYDIGMIEGDIEDDKSDGE